MGLAVIPDVYPQPTAGATGIMVCVDISSSFQGRSHFEVVLSPLGPACTLSGFWPPFTWDLAKGVLDGAGPQENTAVGQVVPVRLALICSERGYAAAWTKVSVQVWMEGCFHRGWKHGAC